MTDVTPETHRTCKVCAENKPIFFFKMARRIRDVKKLCWTCLDCRESARETGTFECRMCKTERPGTDFYIGHGTPIAHPCLSCRKTALPAKRAEERAAKGRGPAHKIDPESVNVETEMGTCAVCGPTQLRRVIQSKTQNVNWRCFTYAASYEMKQRPKQKGFVEKKPRHFLSNQRNELNLADCSICGPDVAIYVFKKSGYGRCRNAHDNHKYSKYGIDLATYKEMYANQEGRCACCGEQHDVLNVDHDHVSGKVRYLLCRACNAGIGHFKDNPETLRRAAYLVELARFNDPYYADQNEVVLQDE